MKNKVAIIVPYFGVLPNYFDLWLESARYNKDFDFLIYTDSADDFLLKKIPNIYIKKIEFVEFADRIRRLFKFAISLESPYKLCDYRPAYGAALREDLIKYDFWGYCDVDLIFGDLKIFITDDILDRNDRIYNLGHFTLFRNIDRMNNFYKIEHEFKDCFSYKYSYTTAFPTAYDEIGTKYGYGMSTICQRMNVKNYVRLDFADVLPDKYEFELAYTEGRSIDYFIYQKGKLFGIRNEEKIEFAYVHLQKRIMLKDQINKDFYYISPRSFRNSREETINDLHSMKEKKLFIKKVVKRTLISKVKKIRQGAVIHYINNCFCRINIK